MSSIPLALPLFQQIQNYQPDKNGQHLCFFDRSYGDYPQHCIYDVVEWGKDFKFFDFYEQSKLEESLPPQMEGEDDQVYLERVTSKWYNYDEDGNPVESKFEFPEMRPFPVSDRAIRANFSDSKIQQKTIEFLKMCGKDVTRITIVRLCGDFVTEILKHLPKVKKIFIEYVEKNNHTADFKFLQTLKGIKNLDIDYMGDDGEKSQETESCIFDSLSKNKSFENSTRLSLRNFRHVSQQEIETLLNSFPNLKKLYFRGSVISEEIVEMILQKLKKLEDLSIDLSSDFIEKMKIKYPHIKIGDHWS